MPGVLHVANDVEVPILDIGGLVLDALERDPDFYFVAVDGEPSLGGEYEILVQIGRGASRLARCPAICTPSGLTAKT